MKAFNIDYLVRKNILEMQPYSSARDEFKNFENPMTYLDANENPFENGVNRYPDTQQKKVKRALSQLKNVDPNQILLGNGSDEVLDLLFRAFCEPNKDNVITLPPTYGMYDVLANLNAIKNREVLLKSDFQPDVSAILNQVDHNTKILFLCSPNNPTGNSFSDESMVTLLRQFKGLIVLDEAYIDFSEKESWLQELNDYPNLVITQTLSKAYGMAGIRMGILYASEGIISILNKIKPPYNINVLSQQKALERIADIEKVNSEISNLKKEKLTLLSAITAIKYIQEIHPSETNFILIRVDDANARYNQLLEKGIVVRNRSTQPLCDNCLRITIGTKAENQQLINVLKSL